jgi:OOP family OmpA-OmpF porin
VGPIRNNGCPVKVEKAIVKVEPVKVELTKEEEEVINTVFKNLQFETGKAIIKPVSFPSLDQLAELMKRKQTFNLLIEGHTDNVGAAKMNLTLSQKRARSAKDYLIKKGVAAERITSKGYGMTKPVAPNSTAEGRQQNRRVEFTIVK